MIYIFDDKKNRQVSYGWTEEKFSTYNEFITIIHKYEDVRDDLSRKKIFSHENLILFHESFFDADFNKHYKETIDIRRELYEFAQDTPTFSVVFFSGSKSSRILNTNIAYLPVSILYQNLEIFLDNTINGVFDLKYLLYGNSPNIEKSLVEKLLSSNSSLLNSHSPFSITDNLKVLIATTASSNRLPRIVIGADYKMNLSGERDLDLHNLIISNLLDQEYDKIFIPLCFGYSLSDFNGLRLAAHIRCTSSINQCKPIFIYSFNKIEEILNHDYFNVLKTENIKLIDYSIEAFNEAIYSKTIQLNSNKLSSEMSKLDLQVPKDYEDNHSVANEWGIYQMARNANIDISEVSGFERDKLTSLYFKWLITKNRLDLPISSEQQKIQKTYAELLPGLKVLGKIDLSKFTK
jgi:hypothetical protein